MVPLQWGSLNENGGQKARRFLSLLGASLPDRRFCPGAKGLNYPGMSGVFDSAKDA